MVQYGISEHVLKSHPCPAVLAPFQLRTLGEGKKYSTRLLLFVGVGLCGLLSSAWCLGRQVGFWA